MKKALAGAALLAPTLTLAQQRVPNASPITTPSSFGIGAWVIVVTLLLAITAFFPGSRAMIHSRHNAPHGPQAPTPRGP